MSYGLEITGNDGTNDFLVMDSNLNPDNYQVVATGSASTINIATVGGSGGEARIFIKPQSGGVTTADVSGTSYSFYRYNTTEDGQGKVIEATRTSISVSYIIIKNIGATSVNSSMGDYGLQIFKSNGDLTFDSRRLQLNNSFRLLGVAGRGSYGGDPQTTAATVRGPSSDAVNTYIEASNLFHSTGSTSGNVHGYERLGSGSGTVIRHAFFNWSEGSGGGGGRAGTNLTYYRSNQFPVVYGELRQ